MKHDVGASPTRGLAGLILSAAIYVCLRGLVLYSAFDETTLPMYELYPMGTMAKLVGEGVPPPLPLYYDNAGGQIFTGLVAAGAYRTGDSGPKSTKISVSVTEACTDNLCLKTISVEQVHRRIEQRLGGTTSIAESSTETPDTD
ncbi:MAG: hypothetical protein ACREQQ_08495 [Candidatus Binatia bacterium]